MVITQKQISYITIFLILFAFVSYWLYSVSVSASDESDSELVITDTYRDIKKVAITFDDGPDPVTTKKLLDGLKERNVQATFFVVGEYASLYPEIIQQMKADGHIIGNHTYTHCHITTVSSETSLSEILKTNQIIYELTGEYPTFIRPPFGDCSKYIEAHVDMFKVLWDVDPLDWNTDNSKKVADYVVQNVSDGDIILLHDIFDSSVEAAFNIIDRLTAQGYEFVTVDEILFP